MGTDPEPCRDDLARRRAAEVESRLGELEATLAEVPATVARCDERAGAALDVARSTREDVRQLRESFDQRFDAIDRAHASAAVMATRIERVASGSQTFGEQVKATFAVLIPILVALIAAYATVRAGG